MHSLNKPQSKCDIFVDEMLSRITKGVYKENEKLPPESYFMEQFGMSRVTIREGFKKLNMLGVVDIRQGRGTFVQKVDMGTLMRPLYSAIVMNNVTVNHIFDARKYLEIGVTELATQNITDEKIVQLETLIKKMDTAIKLREKDNFSKLDITFHEMIVNMSDSSIMISMYCILKETILKYISAINLSIGTIEISEDQHRAIMEAMIARDAKKAALLMGEHVESVKKRYLEMVESGEAPLGIK